MYSEFYATTGRALLLNVLAVACGFGVLIVSQVSQLSDFGNIVMLSMGMSFIASVTLLPALVHVLRPGFLATVGRPMLGMRWLLRLLGLVMLAIVLAVSVLTRDANAAQTDDAAVEAGVATDATGAMDAEAIVAAVNAVPQGEQVTRSLLFRTTDKRGRSRERETVSYRRYFGEERRLVLFFTAPANIRGTAVLTWDYPDPAAEDDQWLYLPALRKVRRIPASDRGDYFLGTDFSFEDMKLDGKLSAEDYTYTVLETSSIGAELPEASVLLGGTPVSEAIAGELGYSRTETVVDTATFMVTRVDFWDLRGEHLKTLHAEDIRPVDGILTRHRLRMDNHQSGHSTELLFSEVDYRSEVEERVFTRQALERGI